MYSLLLKKALPFTLTFALGAVLSALVGLVGGCKPGYDVMQVPSQDGGGGRGRRECRMRRHNLVAETKPLVILHKPVVNYPAARGFEAGAAASASVEVTFGAEGRVTQVRPLSLSFRGRDESLVGVKAMWEAVEQAARRIEFTPETVSGVPVTVTRAVEMELAPAYR